MRYLNSNILSASTYGVHVSQSVRIARILLYIKTLLMKDWFSKIFFWRRVIAEQNMWQPLQGSNEDNHDLVIRIILQFPNLFRFDGHAQHIAILFKYWIDRIWYYYRQVMLSICEPLITPLRKGIIHIGSVNISIVYKLQGGLTILAPNQFCPITHKPKTESNKALISEWVYYTPMDEIIIYHFLMPI